MTQNLMTLSGDISGTIVAAPSYSTIRIDPNYIMLACLEFTIDKYFPDKSIYFRNSLKDIFSNKTETEQLHSLLNLFTDQSIEFLNSMTENEIINFIKLAF